MTSHSRVSESKKFRLSDLKQQHSAAVKVTAFSKGSKP